MVASAAVVPANRLRTHDAGFVGMLTANSFMKREFGSRLIEEFFPSVDLTHMIDTSGAYIPGHGTPTCILLGRNRAPAKGTIRTINGIRGEPSKPVDPAQGKVWTSILDGLYGPNRPRDAFDEIPVWAMHPHSGDAAGDLYQAQCEEARKGRALVQTPPFCRVLLLRETLGRSIQEFGAENTRFIDPACGTGHLLTDAFRILFHALTAEYRAAGHEPPATRRAAEALARVTGCDLDPACIAIARDRLTAAVHDVTGRDRGAYRTDLHVGDSLLHHRPRPGDRLDDAMVAALEAGRYTAVAANPPYIVSPNGQVAQKYRDRYVSAHRQFSLGCPFTELCFGLAQRGERNL